VKQARFALLWLFIFSIPWENFVLLPGTGTMSRVVGAVALGIGVGVTAIYGRIRPPGVFLLVVALFVFWAGLTVYWSIDPDESLKRIKTYVQLAAMAWLIWEVADTEELQGRLLQAFVLACWGVAAATFMSYMRGTFTAENRYTAEGLNGNDVALTLVLGIPMAWYLAALSSSWLGRWLNRAYVPVALVALLLTASRGGFIAALAALALIPWTFGRLDWRSKLVLSVLVVASVWLVAMLVPPSSWERLATMQSELGSGGTMGYRKTIWNAGLSVAINHPVIGVGAGGFSLAVAPALSRPFAAHNAFLAVLVEQGVIGLALFASLFVAAILPSWRLPPLMTRFRVVLIATLIIGVMPLNWDYVKTTWFILALLASQGALAKPVRRRHAFTPALGHGPELARAVGADVVRSERPT